MEPWEWLSDSEEDDVPPGGLELEPVAAVPEDDSALGELGAETEQTAPADVEVGTDFDPCSLADVVAWPEWMDGGFVTPLEDGEACGLISRADDLRVAFAVFPADSENGWLADVDGTAEAVDFGDEAAWLVGWPIVQSSTLIVRLGPSELVIEISARTAAARALMLDTALHFAREIAVHLP